MYWIFRRYIVSEFPNYSLTPKRLYSTGKLSGLDFNANRTPCLILFFQTPNMTSQIYRSKILINMSIYWKLCFDYENLGGLKINKYNYILSNDLLFKCNALWIIFPSLMSIKTYCFSAHLWQISRALDFETFETRTTRKNSEHTI